VTQQKLYCFDTSSYIRAWHEAYPLDVVETFWKRLDKAIGDGIVISPEEVFEEMKKRSDALALWLKERDGCRVEIDDEIQGEVLSILDTRPEMAKNRKGGSSADAWVVGLARLRKATVVSEESLTDSQKRPKIPGVCGELKVPCINLLAFMREQGWKI
jgi:hypothetical protein